MCNWFLWVQMVPFQTRCPENLDSGYGRSYCAEKNLKWFQILPRFQTCPLSRVPVFIDFALLFSDLDPLAMRMASGLICE